MDEHRIAVVTHSLTRAPSRRDVLRGLAATGLGWSAAHRPDGAKAKKPRKDKPNKKKVLCTRTGARCRKAGKNCKKQNCLSAPFTIAAVWSETADHDTVLFVPPETETTGPFPWINYSCTPNTTPCEEMYPFACVDGDETTDGDEVTTVYRLLPGAYEYWIELDSTTPAGELTIFLKDSSGRIVRQWTNPANAATEQVGWHVFNVDGDSGRVASVDTLIAERLASGAHDPNTYLCPI